MAFGHDWIHSIQDYCPLDVQIKAVLTVLTRKTSYLIDFLCTIYFPCYGESVPFGVCPFQIQTAAFQ